MGFLHHFSDFQKQEETPGGVSSLVNLKSKTVFGRAAIGKNQI
jgi:hypothetical protein